MEGNSDHCGAVKYGGKYFEFQCKQVLSEICSRSKLNTRQLVENNDFICIFLDVCSFCVKVVFSIMLKNRIIGHGGEAQNLTVRSFGKWMKNR